jgi:hypothetical protein
MVGHLECGRAGNDDKNEVTEVIQWFGVIGKPVAVEVDESTVIPTTVRAGVLLFVRSKVGSTAQFPRRFETRKMPT